MKYNILPFYKGFDVVFNRELTEDEFDKIQSLFDGQSTFTHVRQNHYFLINYTYKNSGDESLALKFEDVFNTLSKFNSLELDKNIKLPEGKQEFFIHIYEDNDFTTAGIESKELISQGEQVEYTCERVSHYFIESFYICMAAEKDLELVGEEETVKEILATYFGENEHYNFIYIEDEDDFYYNLKNY